MQHTLTNTLARLGARESVTLAPMTTLKVGGAAQFLVQPQTPADLATIQLACLEHGMPLHILSGGSNTLFSDEGFAGVVIKLGASFDYVKQSPESTSMMVGAATSYAKVTKLACASGWHAAAGWAGTPGLIGGAIAMNAGTRRGEIKDAIAEIHGVLNGEKVILQSNEINFSYRHTDLPKGFIITGAKLHCAKENFTSPKKLFAEVKNYQQKRKLTQPSANSAGSFFKNPPGHFAGQVIEECGLKGIKYGGAQVSLLHANFVINDGSATTNDILCLAKIIKEKVHNRLNIDLIPEIRMVGDFK